MSAASHRKRLAIEAAVARGDMVNAREGETMRISRHGAVVLGRVSPRDRLARIDRLHKALCVKLEIATQGRNPYSGKSVRRVIILQQALARVDVLMPFYRRRHLP